MTTNAEILPQEPDNHKAQYEAEERAAYRQLVSWLSANHQDRERNQ